MAAKRRSPQNQRARFHHPQPRKCACTWRVTAQHPSARERAHETLRLPPFVAHSSWAVCCASGGHSEERERRSVAYGDGIYRKADPAWLRSPAVGGGAAPRDRRDHQGHGLVRRCARLGALLTPPHLLTTPTKTHGASLPTTHNCHI